MTVDRAELRRAFGCFVTGVTVATVIDEQGAPRGLTANSFASVSLDPPLVLVCVAKSAGVYPVFARAPAFAINVLHRDQREISVRFATGRPDKFSGLDWRPGATGSPVLAGAVAWFDCTAHERVEAGDHVILIGRVEAFHHSAHTPLGFHRGAYLGEELIAAGAATK